MVKQMQFEHDTVNMTRFERNNYLYFITKGVIFLLFFMVIHQLYKLAPDPFKPLAALISEVNESIYQHFKMGFVIWLLLIIIELIIFKKKISDKNNFIFSRLTTTLIIAWITFSVWNILPMITNNFVPAIEIELAWSFIATLIAGIIGAMFDNVFMKIKYNQVTKILIVIMLVISYLEFVAFSFNIPPDWVFFKGA